MAARPLHKVVEVVCGTPLPQNVRILLSSLSPHLALQRGCDHCGSAGGLPARDGAVQECHHLIGKANSNLCRHGDYHTAMNPIVGCMLLPRLARWRTLSPERRAWQDRTLWDSAEIAEGVRLLQGALQQNRRGEYQLQAAIAVLHDDAATAAETDWPQILEWYDELVALTSNPIARLSRTVALAHVLGPDAALAELDALTETLGEHHRYLAARAFLLERAGEYAAAAQFYADAGSRTPNLQEREHLTRRAATLRARC